MEDIQAEETKDTVSPFSTNKKFISSVIAISLLSGGFYWYQLRPHTIRQECGVDAGKKAFVEDTNEAGLKGLEHLRMQNESFETFYNFCVRSRGLPN